MCLPPIDESVAKLHEQAIGVFTPHMVGTKILEGESEFVGASAYLPTWKGIRQQLGASGQIPRPEDCGSWGRQVGGPS